MRTPLGPSVGACLLSVALLAGATGCGVAGADGDGDPAAATGGVLHLQPVATQGPDPFTDSTAVSTATPPPAARTPGPVSAGAASVALDGLRPLSGGTPGLYGGIQHVGSCDVTRQIGHLAAHPARKSAFAEVAGVSATALPAYLRGLTPVVLRSDTRVTNHGYRDGRAAGYQAVLQAGTAVLVDDRGVPRVRCACGNPLKAPVAAGDEPATRGTPWPGYRPSEVVVVTPAPRAVTDLTLVSTVDDTWIGRRLGHDTRHDRPVPPPAWVTGAPTPAPSAPPTTPPADPPSAPPSQGEASEEASEEVFEEPYEVPYADPHTDPYADPYEDPYGDLYENPYGDQDPYGDLYEESYEDMPDGGASADVV
ncbi:DUF6777-containing protein [Streptomyces sp. BB1-1-1]|uniref:DUF6777 domain-containing protein n=1 Tax=Streptomyces sp. BB1-1-1 TaxID=3074430 RepID=UPI002877807F|nr:DUF6777 domain-containing protein [Streptomyces sp. BB1-1-1]WND33581.1 DUF6777-containing protein [Streptomyces sp. BB1-1-1]